MDNIWYRIAAVVHMIKRVTYIYIYMRQKTILHYTNIPDKPIYNSFGKEWTSEEKVVNPKHQRPQGEPAVRVT